MTSRGTANVLTRTTTYLAIAFFVTSTVLGVLATQNRRAAGPSVIDRVQTPATAPGAPASTPGSGGGVLDQLNQMRQTPAVPAPPTSQ